MKKVKLTPARGITLAFLIVFAFNFWGQFKLSQLSNDNHDLTVKNRTLTLTVEQNARLDALHNCLAINQSFAATRHATDKLGAAIVGQSQGVKNRFEQAGRVTPPKTIQEQHAHDVGEAFFATLLLDTKRRVKTGVDQVKAATAPKDCGAI